MADGGSASRHQNRFVEEQEEDEGAEDHLAGVGHRAEGFQEDHDHDEYGQGDHAVVDYGAKPPLEGAVGGGRYRRGIGGLGRTGWHCQSLVRRYWSRFLPQLLR